MDVRNGEGGEIRRPPPRPAPPARSELRPYGESSADGESSAGSRTLPNPPPPTPVLGCGERSRALSPRGERCAAGGELGVGERRVVRAATSHVVCASEVKP